MFAAEFEPATFATSRRRRSARAPASFDAAAESGLARALCRVVDVSIHGCKLQTYSALRRGAAIWLNLPGLGRIAADVVWADDFAAGCQFHAPLERLALEALPAPRH